MAIILEFHSLVMMLRSDVTHKCSSIVMRLSRYASLSQSLSVTCIMRNVCSVFTTNYHYKIRFVTAAFMTEMKEKWSTVLEGWIIYGHDHQNVRRHSLTHLTPTIWDSLTECTLSRGKQNNCSDYFESHRVLHQSLTWSTLTSRITSSSQVNWANGKWETVLGLNNKSKTITQEC